jgi:hypothetical protein
VEISSDIVKFKKKAAEKLAPLQAAKQLTKQLDWRRLLVLAKPEVNYIIVGTICLFVANVTINLMKILTVE